MRGGGGEKSDGVQLFSLWAHHNSISSKWRENRGEKKKEYTGQNCPSPSYGQFFVFPFFFFSIKSLQVCTVRSHWLWFWFFFLDKILHNRRWFFLFVFICFFFNILLAFAYFINK